MNADAGITPRIACSNSRVKSKVSPQSEMAAKPTTWSPCDTHWLAMVFFYHAVWRRCLCKFDMRFIFSFVGDMMVKVRFNLIADYIQGNL